MKIFIAFFLFFGIIEFDSFGLIQDYDNDPLIIKKSRRSGKIHTIHRNDRINVVDTVGIIAMGYFYQKNETEIIITDNLDIEDAVLTVIQIDRIRSIHLYKSPPKNKAGNILMVSGFITSTIGLTAFILGTIGNSTNNNFIFDQGSMVVGALLLPLGLLQILIGKELNNKTFKIYSGKYEIVNSLEP